MEGVLALIAQEHRLRPGRVRQPNAKTRSLPTTRPLLLLPTAPLRLCHPACFDKLLHEGSPFTCLGDAVSLSPHGALDLLAVETQRFQGCVASFDRDAPEAPMLCLNVCLHSGPGKCRPAMLQTMCASSCCTLRAGVRWPKFHMVAIECLRQGVQDLPIILHARTGGKSGRYAKQSTGWTANVCIQL